MPKEPPEKPQTLGALYSVSSAKKPLPTKEELAAQFAPDPDEEVEEDKKKPEEKIPLVPQEHPPTPTFKSNIVGQPAQHDMRSDVDYGKRYYKDNVPVDLRLLPYYRHYLRHGGYSKTQSFNKMLVQFLISLNYPIPPDILERPFSFEDLPKDY